MVSELHSLHSTLRENIVEHVFVGDALRLFWRLGIVDVEVLHSEFDAHGYDIVMARQDVVRHIQFKTGVQDGPVRVSVNRSLALKPSGCVVWIHVNDNLDLGPFWLFAGAPGEKLPNLDVFSNPRSNRRRKGEDFRTIRENHKKLPGSAFKRHDTLEALLAALFGPLTATPEGVTA